MRLTKEQQISLKRKYEQATQWDTPIAMSFLQFRRTVQLEICGNGAVLLPYGSMWIGIETDGYAHS